MISLMTGTVVDHFTTQAALKAAAAANVSSLNGTVGLPAIDPWYGVTVAATLAFVVGIIQVTRDGNSLRKERNGGVFLQLILCVFHLGFVTSFLSDTFISGYTTGTAILVLTSQIPDIFGLTLKRYYGPFNIIYVRTILFLVRHTDRSFRPTLK